MAYFASQIHTPMFTKILLPLAVAGLLLCCAKSDPLDQPYQYDRMLAPLSDEHGNQLVDSLTITYIIQGQLDYEVKGEPWEGKTYRDMYERGHELAVQERAEAIRDSMEYLMESKRRGR